jgi:hypothetical protein
MGKAHPRPTARALGRAGLGALVLAAVGCTYDGGHRDTRDDPLLGSSARPANQPVAIATANPTGSTVAPPQPTYQPRTPLTPGVPTSNAALAGGGFQPLSGGSDLRIGAPAPGGPAGNGPLPQPAFTDPRSPQPAIPTSSGPVPVPVPAGPGSAAVPTGPVPVPPPGAGGATVPAGGFQGGGLEQSYAAVAARGPVWHRLQYNAETRQYLFEMSVPSKLNASVVRRVEATAASPAEAIARALEQLGSEP